MAYSTSNPPYIIAQGIAGYGKVWRYESTDAAADVDGDGYITDAKALGMKVNDLVQVIDTDATPIALTLHAVVAINANGSADLSNTAFSAPADSD